MSSNGFLRKDPTAAHLRIFCRRNYSCINSEPDLFAGVAEATLNTGLLFIVLSLEVSSRENIYAWFPNVGCAILDYL